MLEPRLSPQTEEFGRLVVGREFARDAARGSLAGDAVAPHVPPGDVVRVDERHGRAPRLGASLEREPLVELARNQRVDAPTLPRSSVRGGEHAAREAVALERALAAPGRPVVVVVGEVPLAEPARGVPVLAQQRAPGGKAWIERAP